MDIYTQLQKYSDYSSGKSEESCELQYENVTLDNVDFRGYDLNNSSFLEVIFNRCDFSGVYMSGAFFCGSTFNNCILSENIFRKAKASYATFEATSIDKFDVLKVEYFHSISKEMTISNSSFVRGHFYDASFEHIVFRNTTFNMSLFDKSTFTNVEFINCKFENTDFKDVIGLENIEFSNASILIDGVWNDGLNNEIKELLLKK